MERTFDGIYKEYYLHVFRFARSLCNSYHDAEDLCSQVFVELFSKFKELDFSEQDPRSWLFQTARYKFYNQAKKNNKLELDPEFIEDCPDYGDSFVKQIVEKDLIIRVKNILETLPVQTREVLSLRLFEELSFKEIASIVTSTEAAVKVKFYRGIETIRRKLEEKQRKVLPVIILSALSEVPLFSDYRKKTPVFSAGGGVLGIVMQKAAILTTVGITLLTGISYGQRILNKPDNNPGDIQEIQIDSDPLPTAIPVITEASPEITPVYTVTPTATISPTIPLSPQRITPTSIPTPTATPTVTPSPPPAFTSYTNSRYGLSMQIPHQLNYSVVTNPECQGMGELAGPGILECDEVSITNANGDTLLIHIGVDNATTMGLEGSCFGGASIGTVTVKGENVSKNPSSTPTRLCYKNANSIRFGSSRIVGYIYRTDNGNIEPGFITATDAILSSIQ